MNSEVVQNAPEGWGLGKTDKGWMTGEAFYEYIGNVFIPYLKEKEIALPVILFLDGHKSHLTMHLSTLCRENGIIVVALVPNTTHMMQPLDVAVFFPLKQKWRKLVKKWRIENDGKDITKFNLPTALHSLLVNNEAFANNVRAGFSTCGLYPFGADFVNYKRVVQSTSNTNVKYDAVPKSVISESSYLTYLESKIDPSLLKDFYLTCESGTDWEGKKEAIMLYDTWLAFKNDTTNHAVAAVSKDINDSPLFDLCGINDIANEMHTPNKEISAKDPSTNNAVQSNGIENPGLPASFLINGDKNNSDTELSLNPAHPSASAFTALNKNDVTRQMDTPKNYNNINEPSTSHESLSKDIEDCLPTSFLETDEKDGFARQMHTPNKNNSNTASSSPDATSNVVESVATPNCTEQAGSTKESTKDKIVASSYTVFECYRNQMAISENPRGMEGQRWTPPDSYAGAVWLGSRTRPAEGYRGCRCHSRGTCRGHSRRSDSPGGWKASGGHPGSLCRRCMVRQPDEAGRRLSGLPLPLPPLRLPRGIEGQRWAPPDPYAGAVYRPGDREPGAAEYRGGGGRGRLRLVEWSQPVR
ncbi:uncharacterized protein LOC134654774 [Cydia amplana]|uniref:uncharacterized protein LOC134654774 n=1 Tax=Cydia amplana TaxID=1869771 RepID=UPI002FE68033